MEQSKIYKSQINQFCSTESIFDQNSQNLPAETLPLKRNFGTYQW